MIWIFFKEKYCAAYTQAHVKIPNNVNLSLLGAWNVYQLLGDLIANPLLECTKEVGWFSSRWLNTYNVKLEVENYNIYVDTEEGILECKHCHS